MAAAPRWASPPLHTSRCFRRRPPASGNTSARWACGRRTRIISWQNAADVWEFLGIIATRGVGGGRHLALASKVYVVHIRVSGERIGWVHFRGCDDRHESAETEARRGERNGFNRRRCHVGPIYKRPIVGPGLPWVQTAAMGTGWHGVWDPVLAHKSAHCGGTVTLARRPTYIVRGRALSRDTIVVVSWTRRNRLHEGSV